MQHFIVILVLTTWITDLAVAETETNEEKCGKLRPEQLYNLKRTAEPTEFPWMAVLIYKTELRDMNMQRNLAILISKQYLITVSSFLDSAPPIAVGFGSADTSFSDEQCKIDTSICPNTAEIETLINPPYNMLKQSYDKEIGFIKLKVPITITDSIRPICLFNPNDIVRDFAAQKLPLAGLIQHSASLSKKYVQVVDADMCSHTSGDSENYICANTCDNGSSFKLGSALMDVAANRSIADHYYLVGILVKRQKFCADSTPDNFFRVYNDPYRFQI